MKKSLLSTLFALYICGAWAAAPVAVKSPSSTDPAVISGTWIRGKQAADKEVSLYRIISGRLEVVSTYNMQGDYRFGFAFQPQGDGFYVIGNSFPTAASNKYVFYFKPGDRLDVAVNDSTYVIKGTPTAENAAMQKWHDYTYLLEQKSVYFSSAYGRSNGMPSTYVDFFPLLEKMAGPAQAYTSTTANKKFDKDFALFRKYDMLRYAWTFIMTPRTAHPATEDYTEFYRNNTIEKFTATGDLLKYPFGVNTITMGMSVKQKVDGTDVKSLAQYQAQTPEDRAAAYEKSLSTGVINDTLKGEIALTSTAGIKTFDQYEQFNKQYGKYIITQDQKDRLAALLTKVSALEKDKGQLKTMDFSGTDINGKTVSLSDFKGKVVVVDVWATWCGPCRGEIPYLKKLEIAYHDKNVVFLSISIDDAKSLDTWKKFVADEQLTGVQIFGGKGWNSDVAAFYGIKGIPRFMVFGKDGKIVTDDAPRPSEPALAAMLDTQLAK